jgi:hypothetical protein
MVEAGVCACAVASTSIPPVSSVTANMFGLCITLVSHPSAPIANSARSKDSYCLMDTRFPVFADSLAASNISVTVTFVSNDDKPSTLAPSNSTARK